MQPITRETKADVKLRGSHYKDINLKERSQLKVPSSVDSQRFKSYVHHRLDILQLYISIWQPDMLKFVVKKSAKNIFHDAVANKDVSRLKFLLQNNRESFKIDELDEDGLTALQRSCFIGNLKLVQLLVTFGANIEIQDREGWSVLHASAVAGNSSILKYLVCMGADVAVKNDLGELAIDLANDLDCVIILAEAMISAGHGDLIDGYFAKRPSMKALIENKLREVSKKSDDLSGTRKLV